MHVDDFASEAADDDQALRIHRKSQELVSQGGFMFRAWHSNSARIRDVIAAQESCAETTKGKATQSKHDNQNADPDRGSQKYNRSPTRRPKVNEFLAIEYVVIENVCKSSWNWVERDKW